MSSTGELFCGTLQDMLRDLGHPYLKVKIPKHYYAIWDESSLPAKDTIEIIDPEISDNPCGTLTFRTFYEVAEGTDGLRYAELEDVIIDKIDLKRPKRKHEKA